MKRCASGIALGFTAGVCFYHIYNLYNNKKQETAAPHKVVPDTNLDKQPGGYLNPKQKSKEIIDKFGGFPGFLLVNP
jgi:hypothetical protein